MLRVLMIMHMPWTRDLGGPRVQVELADELRARGHIVDKFDYFDAFPDGQSRLLRELLPRAFAQKALAYVRANGHRFNVVDAQHGNLPFSKRQLGFRGLVVARSAGLYAFYDEFERQARRRWPRRARGSLPGYVLRRFSKRARARDCEHSLREADVISVHNNDEFEYVRDVLGLGHRCVILPPGIVAERAVDLAEAADPGARGQKRVAFIGYWGLRKGAADWGAIVSRTRELVPATRFRFLGTGCDEQRVLADLQQSPCDWIEVVPTFETEELPRLLAHCTVGAFPSYVEGFGIGVLEKLAAGLPTVAYDVPGPREMLRELPAQLVPPGDIDAFSSALAMLLTMPTGEYASLSRRCMKLAQRFLWSGIAETTERIYLDNLPSEWALR